MPAQDRENREPVTRSYAKGRIDTIWRELTEARRQGVLAEPDGFPGLDRGRANKPIKRIRKALLDDHLGLGMQLRWCLALEALRGKAVASGVRACLDAREAVCKDCGWPRIFNQLGAGPGREPVTFAHRVHDKTTSNANVNMLCQRLNDVYQGNYQQVSKGHRMTPELFRTPCFGLDATDEFNHLLRTGEVSRHSKTNRQLLHGERRYFPSRPRDAIERQLIARLKHENGSRPIQCISAEGAPTAVEAFALHLAATLPAAVKHARAPRRDILLAPCGRWVHPATDRGMEYLVQTLSDMLFHDQVSTTPTDMSEEQLQQKINLLRDELGRRPVIIIFVGHDAIAGPLARLQEAVVDAPLVTLLAHLSRPALGTQDDPYDPRHFAWTYFLVIGTADIPALGEYQQPALMLHPIGLENFGHVIKDTGFEHVDELCRAMQHRTEAPTEAVICLFEQLRRLEEIRAKRGEQVDVRTFASLTRSRNLTELSQNFLRVLNDPQRRLEQAAVLLTAFAIGGIKRATLIRCFMLWDSVFPNLALKATPRSIEKWTQFFDAWLTCFSPLIKSGTDERWGEIDPQQHPFEYAGTLVLNMTCDRKEWWEESIDFSIADVRNAIVQNTDWRLAEGIHRIVAEEALRQHTMVLRHTFRANRLLMRSHRRGLQALYHGLSSLPHHIDAQSHDENIDPALHFNVSLPAQHLARFKYLYYGLLPALLRDDTAGHFGTAWGAEAVKLEIALFADALFFHDGGDVQRALSPSMRARHHEEMAIAAVRMGPHAGWSDVQARLAGYTKEEEDATLVDKVLLQMNLIERGPDDDETRAQFNALARKLDASVTPFDEQLWQTEGGAEAAFPTVELFEQLVTRQVSHFLAAAPPHKSDISTLLFIYGMMGADSEESRPHDRPPKGAIKASASHLLKCFAAMVTASELMWDGYGEDNCPLPYLAAEGLRTLCRVGLEILRVLQKNNANVFLDNAKQVDDLVDTVTARVRRTLDEYAQVFSTNESERTHMLILEARFARIAYLRDPAWRKCSNSLDILTSAYQADWPAASESRRYEVALTFLREAEASLLNFQASDALRIRLLSERCSTLRYLAMNLVRHARAEPDLPGAADMCERAKMACQLGLLDVRQLKNIIARLAQSRTVWLTSGAKAKWSNTADSHEAALLRLGVRMGNCFHTR
ncbi:MAG: hypothetical protein ACJ8HJ_00450 [Massilia sp.]